MQEYVKFKYFSRSMDSFQGLFKNKFCFQGLFNEDCPSFSSTFQACANPVLPKLLWAE